MTTNANGEPTLAMSLSDLERRLKTDRTMDIFTMKPKVILPSSSTSVNYIIFPVVRSLICT